MDVLAAWEAFEAINKCRVVLRFEPVSTTKLWLLEAHAAVWSESPDLPEAKLLACESVRCSGSEYAGLDTLVFRLLYALDGKLASRELENVERK
jgi:hypothetical protein